MATDELLEKMNELAGHPAITLKPNFQEEEFVLLRNTIDGQKRLIDYVETPKTFEYRKNLIKIKYRPMDLTEPVYTYVNI